MTLGTGVSGQNCGLCELCIVTEADQNSSQSPVEIEKWFINLPGAGVKTGCMGGPSATSPDVKIFIVEALTETAMTLLKALKHSLYFASSLTISIDCVK